MFFFQEQRTRKKFSHRVAVWEKVTGYSGRRIVCRGKRLDAAQYTLPAPLPAMTGRKIVFFSDLHWRGGSERELEIIREAADFVAGFKPDVMISGGDLISYAANIKSALDALKMLPPATEQLAVPGNWERSKKWISKACWRAYYAAGGYQLLINQAYCAGPLRFYGLDDVKAGQPHLAPDFSGYGNVLLAHSPDAAIQAGRGDALKRISLILCGHTHAGQIRLPLLGAFAASSRYRLKFDYGHFIHRQTGTRLLVSAGIGTSCVPFRFRCRPEVVFIELV